MNTVVSEFDVLQNDVFELQGRMEPYFEAIQASYPINQKSTLNFGNITINSTKHFNWFQKLMWKWCFGVKIKDCKKRGGIKWK